MTDDSVIEDMHIYLYSAFTVKDMLPAMIVNTCTFQ